MACALSRDDLGVYGIIAHGHTPAHVHQRWIDAATAVLSGTSPKRKLLIVAPPGHAKSTWLSLVLPPWYLGNHPDHSLLFFTSADTMARQFGTTVKATLEANEAHAAVFPEPDRRPDSGRGWSTDGLYLRGTPAGSKDPSYRALGYGAAVVGARAHGIILDDPLTQEQARSPVEQLKARQYYDLTIDSRLHPDGWVLAIMCMTGDTPVLMATGYETPLRDIRPGDRVATYDNGTVSVSTVRNWANNGPDQVFEIRMKSGSIVKANARHPFLVEEGGATTWQRTSTLKSGSIILRVTGASGEASSAPQPSATSQPHAKACAARTTAKIGGAPEFDRRLLALDLGATLGCATGTGLGLLSMSASLLNRAACVPSASNPPPARTPERIGTTSSASIIATMAQGSGASSATTATLWSATDRPRPYSSPLLSTYGITRDTVVEVVDGGIEDVFDVEIEGTENFIANGLVSHNTRWHDSDLAAHLAAKSEWSVLSLPALDDDDRALWPERFSVDWLHNKRAEIGGPQFSAIYLNDPRALGGLIFKESSWFRPIPADLDRATLTILQFWDTAFSERQTADYSACCTLGIAPDGRMIILEMYRARLSPSDLEAAMIARIALWKPSAVGVEEAAFRQAVTADLVLRLAQRASARIQAVKPQGDKVARAYLPAGRGEAGLLYADRDAPWFPEFDAEALGFPLGSHDDQVDALSGAAQMAADHLATRARAHELAGMAGTPMPINRLNGSSNGKGVDPKLEGLFSRG